MCRSLCLVCVALFGVCRSVWRELPVRIVLGTAFLLIVR